MYQVLPSRYGFDPADLRQADAVEIVVGQGAKPGGGGMLLGQKVNERVAAMRTLPPGIDQRSASRHPDWVGPDDLRIKIEELREATDWTVPVYVKVGATRVDHDVKLAVAAGADVVVVDGMQGGTAATQDVFIEHTGIPTLPAVRMAAEALDDIGAHDEVQLIVSGGIRSGADVAKALALGADAVSIGVAALMALGCNRGHYTDSTGRAVDVQADYLALGTSSGNCTHCHTGRCPVGITTQDPELEARLDPDRAASSRGQLPAGSDHGGHRARPGLRQVRRPPPRARGPGGPHHRGGRHGPGTPGRDRLDPRLAVGGTAVSRAETADVVVIGGGVAGLSTARALVELGIDDVLVLERTAVGSGGSGKSSGVVRCHYGVRSLAAMAWHSLPVLEHATEILGAESGYRRTGYLVGVGQREPRRAAGQRGHATRCRHRGRPRRPARRHRTCGPSPASTSSPEFAFEPKGGYGDGHLTAMAFAGGRPEGWCAPSPAVRGRTPSTRSVTRSAACVSSTAPPYTLVRWY